MRPLRLSLLFAALVLAAGHGQARAVPPSPAAAVVRIPSHGASATVIDTRDGATLLLGCAHAFQGADRRTPIALDVPVPAAGRAKRAAIRLLDVDYAADLSLILLEDGPLPYVAPVAPAGHKPGQRIVSVGYDAMRWPAVEQPATILAFSPATTFTRERPGHGRSGGGLLDLDNGCLIGVVQGYETAGARRGVYVSHATVLRFLDKARGERGGVSPPSFPTPLGALTRPRSPC